MLENRAVVEETRVDGVMKRTMLSKDGKLGPKGKTEATARILPKEIAKTMKGHCAIQIYLTSSP